VITDQTLIEWGFEPGSWFQGAIEMANRMRIEGASDDAIFGALQARVPAEMDRRTNTRPFSIFLEPENDQERANLQDVSNHMDVLMRVPTIVAGALMPDACPSGSQEGTIPVGGAIAAEDAIHPGFHSSDICCSVAITVFKRADNPKRLLDAMQATTHFGPGGRSKILRTDSLAAIIKKMDANPFLKGLENLAVGHFGSQGDGNHFAYVGHCKSTACLRL
jgi:hypothetical protein